MRIIKFRGLRCGYRKEWDKEKGWVELNGWVYGSLINNMWVYNGTTYEKGTPVCEIITGDTDEDNWQDAIDDLSNTIKVKTESIFMIEKYFLEKYLAEKKIILHF